MSYVICSVCRLSFSINQVKYYIPLYQHRTACEQCSMGRLSRLKSDVQNHYSTNTLVKGELFYIVFIRTLMTAIIVLYSVTSTILSHFMLYFGQWWASLGQFWTQMLMQVWFGQNFLELRSVSDSELCAAVRPHSDKSFLGVRVSFGFKPWWCGSAQARTDSSWIIFELGTKFLACLKL